MLGNISCDLDAKVEGQLMYLLLSEFPPKPRDIATSNFAGI